MSVLRDAKDWVADPAALFQRRAESSPWRLLLVVSLLAAPLVVTNGVLAAPLLRAESAQIDDSIRASHPSFTREDLQRAHRVAARMAMVIRPLIVPAGILLLSGAVWLAVLLTGGQVPYRVALTIAALASITIVLRELSWIAQYALFGSGRAASTNGFAIGPARWLDPGAAAPLVAVAQQCDLFVLWQYVLVAIGLHAAGKLSWRKAGIASALVWLGSGILRVLAP